MKIQNERNMSLGLKLSKTFFLESKISHHLIFAKTDLEGRRLLFQKLPEKFLDSAYLGQTAGL